jgi:hypothetical protein
MAAGDRTQLFTFTQVASLEAQINDTSTGLVTKVDQLENNPVYTLIKEYDAAFVYSVGYPIKRDGKLYVCNTASTTGAFDALKWTVLGRANTDDLIVEAGSDKITIKVASGIPTFEFTDGTLVRNAEFRPDNGRIRLTGSTGLSNASDNDVLVKGDVQATADRYTFDDTKKRLKQTATATEVASDDNHVLLKSDVPFTKTEVTYDATAKRISVVDDATATASDDKHVLTKKDGDLLYQPIGAALDGITLPNRGVHSLDPRTAKDTEIFKFETLAPLDAGVPTTVSVYASAGSDQIKFYLSSRVPYFAKFQGTRAVTTRTNGEVKGADGTVVYAAARRWLSGTTGHATAQTLTTNGFDREDCVSLIMQFGKGGGDAHKFSCSCQIELTPVDSGSMNLTVTPLSGKQQS